MQYAPVHKLKRIYTCQQKGKMVMNRAAQLIMTRQNCNMATGKIRTKAAIFFSIKSYICYKEVL